MELLQHNPKLFFALAALALCLALLVLLAGVYGLTALRRRRPAARRQPPPAGQPRRLGEAACRGCGRY